MAVSSMYRRGVWRILRPVRRGAHLCVSDTLSRALHTDVHFMNGLYPSGKRCIATYSSSGHFLLVMSVIQWGGVVGV